MLFFSRRTTEHRGRRALPPWRYRIAGLAAAALALSFIQANAGNAAGDATSQAGPKAAADVVRVAEFLAECPYTHRAPDDPIVFPGLPGASHMHSFFGNDTTNARSDLASLEKGRTTCAPDDRPVLVLGAHAVRRRQGGGAHRHHVLLPR